MNLNTRALTKNKTLMAAGIAVLAAGALAYPAVRLYKYVAKKRKASKEDKTTLVEDAQPQMFGAYRGNHKPHHRKKADATNGQLQVSEPLK